MLLSTRAVCLVTLSRTSLEKKNSKKFDVFCFGLEKTSEIDEVAGQDDILITKFSRLPTLLKEGIIFFFYFDAYTIL